MIPTLYVCEDHGIIRHIDDIVSGCPECGETMVPWFWPEPTLPPRKPPPPAPLEPRLWHQDADVTLYHGDALETLRGLPDASVQCVISSPPFWGLRDYGTGSWVGGDADCDHAIRTRDRGPRNDAGDAFRNSSRYFANDETARSICGRCGARRVDQQIGLEDTPDAWCARLVNVYRECRRVLRDDGVMFLEIGDSYAGGTTGRNDAESLAAIPVRRGAGGTLVPSGGKQKGGEAGATGTTRRSPPGLKAKDLVGAPWMLAFALRADGWYLRADCIWSRPNPMPESVTDRPTKAHSYVFVLTKRARYFWDADNVREPNTPAGAARANQPERRYADHLPAETIPPGHPTERHLEMHHNGLAVNGGGASGRNLRSVWEIATEPTPFAHFATFPQRIVERCIRAATSEHGACSVCGAPWRRITEKEYDGTYREVTGTHPDSPHLHQTGVPRLYAKNNGTSLPVPARSTIGWMPSCRCYADPCVHEIVPCVVLDCFSGSGTTALVARRLGRRAIGIELNAEYLDITRQRLALPDEDGAVLINGHAQLALLEPDGPQEAS